MVSWDYPVCTRRPTYARPPCMAAYQYIYVMNGVTKTFSNGKTVLNNIRLSFYPDAKIGILGPNGSGKSTLMKIMAGLDKDYSGEAFLADGAKIGYLEQEPQLDPTMNVEQNVLAGLGETKALLDRFEEVSMKLGEVEDPDEMQALIDEQGELQEKIELPMRGIFRALLKLRWTLCAVPPLMRM